MIIKRNIILALLFSFTLGLSAGNSVIDSAAANYKAGNFEKSIELYQSLIDQGYQSSDIYYNIACSYFKVRDLPNAILFFERASLLNPGDEDISYNLEFSRSLIIDKIEVLPPFFLNQWYLSLRSLLSSNGWSYFSLGTFCLFLLLFLLYFFTRKMFIKKTSFWFGIIFFTVSVIGFLFAYKQYCLITDHKGAIIFNPSVTVKSSPDDAGTDLFILHEGTKVFLEENIGEWYRIKLHDGSVGWMKEKDFKKI